MRHKIDNLTIAEYGSDADRSLLIGDPNWQVREAVAKFGNKEHREQLRMDRNLLVRSAARAQEEEPEQIPTEKQQQGQVPAAFPVITILLFAFILLAFFSTAQTG